MVRRKPKTVLYRRKRKQKTDYNSRLKLLLSGKIRLVVRKSLKHTVAQLIEYMPKGDKVVVSAHSAELKKLGWQASTANIPASYLVGFLLGKKALKNNIKEAILDIGLQQSAKGTRLYAVLKGALDAGLNIPHSEDVLPSEERIRGDHISQFMKIAKEKGLKNQFAKQTIDTPKSFDDLKNKISAL